MFAKKTEIPDISPLARKDELPDITGIQWDLEEHTENETIHVTAADKTRWDSGSGGGVAKEYVDGVAAKIKDEIVTEIDNATDITRIAYDRDSNVISIPSMDEFNSLKEDLAQKADKSELPDISGKQDAISDLDDIRDGASKGATALQSIPMANQSTLGGVKTASWAGVDVFQDSGVMYTRQATETQINNRKEYTVYTSIAPQNIDYAVKAAMCDGKGSAWTATEKAAALSRLGIVVDDNGICHFG